MADEKTLVALLHEKEDEIRSQVPSWLDPERFMAANYELRHLWLRDENLRKCSNESLVNCIYESARTGLEFAAKHAYVVAYGNDATFMPGYRGKIFLKIRSGAVKLIVPDIIYEKDEFFVERDSSNPELAHIVHRYARGDRGKPTGSYALAKLISGEVDFEVCGENRIGRSRSKSKQPNGLMWGTFWEEAWKKTPIHILDKRLPEGVNTEAIRAYRLAVSLEERLPDPEDDGELKEDERPKAKAKLILTPDNPPQVAEGHGAAGDPPTGTLQPTETPPDDDPTLTETEGQALADEAKRAGLSIIARGALLERFGVDTYESLRQSQVPAFLDAMKAMVKR